MVKLKVVATGSKGNCYLLEAENETLILDVGVPIKELKKALNFNIRNVVGAVLTHGHHDHSRALNDLLFMGITVLTPYMIDDPPERLKSTYGKFQVTAIAMTDINGHWVHTNGDGSECPVYGFLIYHPQMGNLLYVTDVELIKYRFKDIDHVLLGVNYQEQYLEEESPKRRHVFRGHLELKTACDFIKVCSANKPLQNVVACHLSDSSIDGAECSAELRKVAGNAEIRIAEPRMELKLYRQGECPFWE